MASLLSRALKAFPVAAALLCAAPPVADAAPGKSSAPSSQSTAAKKPPKAPTAKDYKRLFDRAMDYPYMMPTMLGEIYAAEPRREVVNEAVTGLIEDYVTGGEWYYPIVLCQMAARHLITCSLDEASGQMAAYVYKLPLKSRKAMAAVMQKDMVDALQAGDLVTGLALRHAILKSGLITSEKLDAGLTEMEKSEAFLLAASYHLDVIEQMHSTPLTADSSGGYLPGTVRRGNNFWSFTANSPEVILFGKAKSFYTLDLLIRLTGKDMGFDDDIHASLGEQIGELLAGLIVSPDAQEPYIESGRDGLFRFERISAANAMQLVNKACDMANADRGSTGTVALAIMKTLSRFFPDDPNHPSAAVRLSPDFAACLKPYRQPSETHPKAVLNMPPLRGAEP